MSDSNKFKSVIFAAIITVLALALTLGAAEILLRVKNSDGQNYHIEMWKYSRVLKTRSDNPVLGHEHIPNKEAKLQNVTIRLNEHGMRGSSLPVLEAGQRRVLFIGSSATLGWGVEEEKTMSAILQDKFDQSGRRSVVMNAGIGNYNTERYVELFLSKNTDVKPTDVVVNYYLNDAEVLEQGGGNILIRNSQLAVTFWILANRLAGEFGHASLYDHYRSIYQKDYPGFIAVETALKSLSVYAQENNIRLYLMMMPEVHDLTNYQYHFAHDIMRELAGQYGYVYIDALSALQRVENEKSLWAMPGDPHPNDRAHGVFADLLYWALTKDNLH